MNNHPLNMILERFTPLLDGFATLIEAVAVSLQVFAQPVLESLSWNA